MRATAHADLARLEEAVEGDRDDARSRGGRLIAFLGDSYAQGVCLDSPLSAFPYLCVPVINSVLVNGRGGSGYSRSGPWPNSTFLERLPVILQMKPDVLVVQGGLNDLGHKGARDAVSRFYGAVSGAKIPVFALGVFTPPRSVDKDQAEAFSSWISDAATSAGALYVPTDGWITSFGEDRYHPDEFGHQQIAARLVEAGLMRVVN